MQFRKLDGYMTVEATAIVSICCLLILLVMGLLFYQHDRCLLEHDTELLAFRGRLADAEDAGAKGEFIRTQAGRLYRDHYIVCETFEVDYKVNGQMVEVEQSGRFDFAFGKYGALQTKTTVHLISPPALVREFRKWKKIRETK